MGVVYEAEDERLKRRVALKFIAAGDVATPESKARFVSEAQTASALDHPNICAIHEIDETADGRLFIAMPAYEGETLQRRLTRGPLAVADALEIGIQVASGLAAAHDTKVVHRDVKPANL